MATSVHRAVATVRCRHVFGCRQQPRQVWAVGAAHLLAVVRPAAESRTTTRKAVPGSAGRHKWTGHRACLGLVPAPPGPASISVGSASGLPVGPRLAHLECLPERPRSLRIRARGVVGARVADCRRLGVRTCRARHRPAKGLLRFAPPFRPVGARNDRYLGRSHRGLAPGEANWAKGCRAAAAATAGVVLRFRFLFLYEVMTMFDGLRSVANVVFDFLRHIRA